MGNAALNRLRCRVRVSEKGLLYEPESSPCMHRTREDAGCERGMREHVLAGRPGDTGRDHPMRRRSDLGLMWPKLADERGFPYGVYGWITGLLLGDQRKLVRAL